ncbi:MAG: GerMN domain-containing protein [Treponema sp.]|nr:GerMN domain-containing protein [Treponema sp.]
MAQRNSSKKEKSKSSKSKKTVNMFTAGCVVLGLFILVIVFLANKNRIFTNWKETNFWGSITGSNPQFIENHESTPKDNASTDDEQIVIKIEDESAIVPDDEPVVIPLAGESSTAQAAATTPASSPAPAASAATTNQTAASSAAQTQSNNQSSSLMEIQLCFVMIDGDGSVVRKMAKRTVAKTDSPLTYSINELLKGPNSTISGEKNLSTLIPKGTKLLSAKVQNKVAYLNFNQAFEFNEIGIEGYIHQLEQIVYTATAFSTVESVQFLIEGQKVEYLAEAQWIGSPLSRKSF